MDDNTSSVEQKNAISGGFPVLLLGEVAHSELLVHTCKHSSRALLSVTWNSVYRMCIVSSVKTERLSFFSVIPVSVVSLTETGGEGSDD